MSDTIDISGTFRGLFCNAHLPGDDGQPTIGGPPDAKGLIAFRAFADARLDDGPRVLVAIALDDATTMLSLGLQEARTVLQCFSEAVAAAEKLQ